MATAHQQVVNQNFVFYLALMLDHRHRPSALQNRFVPDTIALRNLDLRRPLSVIFYLPYYLIIGIVILKIVPTSIELSKSSFHLWTSTIL